MVETRSVEGFSVADYVVFALLLASNAVIGIYYAYRDRRDKKENTREYLLGGRNQGVIPVGLSLAVTLLSANTMIGVPAEVYYYHTMTIYTLLGYVIGISMAAWVFIPFFHRLGYTTTFQYLEERFNSKIRALGACFTVCQTLLYMAFVLYAPAIALSAVAGIGFTGCVVGMGVIVTFYTALGGMKTVLWTDTFQSVIMVAGLLAVFIQGLRVVGGWNKAWDIANQRGRVVFDEFSFEPNVRHSFLSLTLGSSVALIANYGVNQSQVQRCLATPSVSKARIALLVSLPVIVAVVLLSCLNGVIMFAFYADCDPVKSGVVTYKDQILPLFMLDIMGHAKGFPGLFVASVFAGSFSSLSSGLNAIAAIVYEEFRRSFDLRLSDRRAVVLTKVIAIGAGAVSVGLTFIISQLGTIMQALIAVYGLVNGPLFGLFLLGMFFPWTNSIGAFIGFVASAAFMCWIGIGAFVHKIRTETPGLTTIVGCDWTNGTEPSLLHTNTSLSVTPATLEYSGVENLYTLSYQYYTLVGCVITVVIGMFVSYVTGFTHPSSIHPKLVTSFFYLMKAPTDEEVSTSSQERKTKTNKKIRPKNGWSPVVVEDLDCDETLAATWVTDEKVAFDIAPRGDHKHTS